MSEADPSALDLLLVYPPYERLRGLPVKAVPWNLLLLATIVRDRGWRVRVYNGEYAGAGSRLRYTSADRSRSMPGYAAALADDEHEAWHDLRAVLRELRPRVVGVSFTTPTCRAAERCAQIARDELPDAVVVAGGPHVTLFPERVAALPAVDVAVVGEGDLTLPELLAALVGPAPGRPAAPALSTIAGLAFRGGDGAVRRSAARAAVGDLDTLPIPDRRLLHRFADVATPTLSNLLASRGCPYDCSFCASVPLWGRRVRMRSAEHILREVETLHREFGVGAVRFFDDTFTALPATVRAFCRGMVARGLHRKLTWNCEMRVNHASDELLRLMHRAGCRCVSFGVESGSDRVLAAIGKGTTTAMVRAAVAAARRQGLLVHAYFMVGLPMEDEGDLRATLAFMRELAPDSVNLCTFCPLPGTRLYDELVAAGQLPAVVDFAMYDEVAQQSRSNYFCPAVPRERYDALVGEAMAEAERLTLALSPQKLRHKLREILKNPGFFLRHALRRLVERAGLRAPAAAG